MIRRQLLAGGAAIGASAVAVPLAAPAIAQTAPEIRWRLASSFPRSLDTIYGAGEHVAKRVAALTDNRFQIRAFPAGELVPGLQVADAVQNGTVECAHTASYYFVGKDPTFAFDGAVPFGMNMRQTNAWLQQGGGRDVLKEFFATYNMVSIPAGNTGAQMGGWFRKEIKTVKDLEGLKFRVGGFAGNVLQKLGVVPQQIAGGDIYPALEKGTIDAAEWIGPYDDEKLGFNRVAPFYYYPGWWEGCLNLSMFINKAKYEELPALYKEALESACRDATIETMAKYDVQNPPALRRLIAGGAQLRPFPRDVMQASYKAAFELYDETAAKNETFKKVYAHWKAFRDEQYGWSRVAEYSFDQFVYAMYGQEAQARR
ncbi:ABC transporter substrate-binding protein [Pseudoroseomonas rhizosphaerae]|uniref:ABC transporter substrate-binding protein n=1 Tax=Teichococcus rhizosphaerae TaxID=1335062 RepID=A0A2C7A7P4_9PROT|nr:TRAP transporter substrate-binding protein [Pseudoroseomonas rhizosphaerae]PHK93054.1 ABC transporter substrate-binding protein [Pseudoroseomonas rhizosphaerae]